MNNYIVLIVLVIVGLQLCSVLSGGEKCKCGNVNSEAPAVSEVDHNKDIPRVIGGEIIHRGKYPWLAQIRIKRQFYRSLCGGSLINDMYVLTAAHCTNNFLPGWITNDIALLKLHKRVQFSSIIAPVCLPTDESRNYSFQSCIVVGWGKRDENSFTASEYPFEVQLTVTSLLRCFDQYVKSFPTTTIVTPKMLCAAELNKDACQGDSGGPLIFINGDDGRAELIGIVSFGIGCARLSHDGVYTRVTSHLDWIHQHLTGGNHCKNEG